MIGLSLISSTHFNSYLSHFGKFLRRIRFYNDIPGFHHLLAGMFLYYSDGMEIFHTNQFLKKKIFE